jgi:hypothetical protein
MNTTFRPIAFALPTLCLAMTLAAPTVVQAQYTPATPPQQLYFGTAMPTPAPTPTPMYVPPAPQVVYSAGTVAAPSLTPGTVTPLYTPVTLFNWWRPRTLAGYMITPPAPTTVARPIYPSVLGPPAVAAPAVAAPAVAAPGVAHTVAAPQATYYQPSYHPSGIVVGTPPSFAAAPVTAAPVVAAAPAPVIYARPVTGPRQAYLYSRGPLGFPRLDPVPVGTVVPVGTIVPSNSAPAFPIVIP